MGSGKAFYGTGASFSDLLGFVVGRVHYSEHCSEAEERGKLLFDVLDVGHGRGLLENCCMYA